MTNQKTIVMTSQQLSQLVVAGMQEKKAKDIVVMDLRKVQGAVADFFVLCTGTSDTHVRAIHKSVDEFVYQMSKEEPWQVEGATFGDWILLDYSNVVVHIFQKAKRGFYAIEELWGDAKFSYIPEGGEQAVA